MNRIICADHCAYRINWRTAKSLDQQIAHLSKGEEFVIDTIERFDTAPEWQLPEPSGLMTAKAYVYKFETCFTKSDC